MVARPGKRSRRRRFRPSRPRDPGATTLWLRPERQEWLDGGYDHAGIHSIVVDPRDDRHVTVAVSCGGVWQTRDRGETWANTSAGMVADLMPPERREDPNIQDVHRLAACESQPGVLWAQHHSGLYRLAMAACAGSRGASTACMPVKYLWNRRDASSRALGDRSQTRGTFGLFYTLLGQERFGTVDWR